MSFIFFIDGIDFGLFGVNLLINQLYLLLQGVFLGFQRLFGGILLFLEGIHCGALLLFQRTDVFVYLFGSNRYDGIMEAEHAVKIFFFVFFVLVGVFFVVFVILFVEGAEGIQVLLFVEDIAVSEVFEFVVFFVEIGDVGIGGFFWGGGSTCMLRYLWY